MDSAIQPKQKATRQQLEERIKYLEKFQPKVPDINKTKSMNSQEIVVYCRQAILELQKEKKEKIKVLEDHFRQHTIRFYEKLNEALEQMRRESALTQETTELSIDQVREKIEKQVIKNIQMQLQTQKTNQKSRYYNQTISPQLLNSLKSKFLNRFRDLSSNHNYQLLFLVQMFTPIGFKIRNNYCVDDYFLQIHASARYRLLFDGMTREKMDLGKFLRMKDWNHLVEISFADCGWVNDQDWGKIVFWAENTFANVEFVNLSGNKVTQVNQSQIKSFKSLQKIDLRLNPLDQQTKQKLPKLRQLKKYFEIYF